MRLIPAYQVQKTKAAFIVVTVSGKLRNQWTRNAKKETTQTLRSQLPLHDFLAMKKNQYKRYSPQKRLLKERPLEVVPLRAVPPFRAQRGKFKGESSKN